MAISYKGSVTTPIQFGDDSVSQNLFAIEVGIASRVNVIVRRLLVQNDPIQTNTSYMPIVRTSRATGVSGGIILSKQGTYDSTYSASDPAVAFRANERETSPLIATSGTTIFQQYTARQRTAVEQQTSWDNNLLPLLCDTKDFVLRPGEFLLCEVEAGAAAANAIGMNNWWVECVWEEVPITTFAISGVVTLNTSPIVGAKVFVMEARDHSLTDAVLREVVTTTTGGAWSSTIRTGWHGFAFVQYDNGGTLYTAPGYPYLA